MSASLRSIDDRPPVGPLDHGPLTGVRVVDFTWVLAGPYCTRILADFGAEVIKVQSRAVGAGTDASNETGYFVTWNRNKHGITINMQRPEGIAIAKRLIARCDVVVENFSARVLRNWQLDYESMRELRDDIILVSMSGLGHSGPWRDRVSFGPTLQALSGITALMAEPGQLPPGFGYSYADHVGGVTAALATLAALEERETSGRGQFIDISQLESMAALMGPAVLDASANGRIAEPRGNRPHYLRSAPHQAYPCRGDDRWIAISVRGEEQWNGLLQALGNPAWGSDPRFATDEDRDAHADTLDAHIAEWTRERDPYEAMRILQDRGVPAGVVQLGDDLYERDPQLRERRFFVSASHPSLGETRFDGFPVLFSETGPTLRRSAPLLGQDNALVFGRVLGLSPDEVRALEEDRVLW